MNDRVGELRLSRAPDGQQCGKFEFATVIESASRSAIGREQPVRGGSINAEKCVNVTNGLSRGHANSHHVHIAGRMDDNTRSSHRIAFRRAECNEQRVHKALWFGPHGVNVGIHFDVALVVAQFTVMFMHPDRIRTRVVNGQRFGLGLRALRELAEVLKQGFHAFRFCAQRLNRLFHIDIAELQHVRGRTNGGNAIAQGMCYAA